MCKTLYFIGDDDASSEPNWGMDHSTVVNVKELHISSPILAAKSPFFYKVSSLEPYWFLLVYVSCNHHPLLLVVALF